MKIKIKLFASCREIAGINELELQTIKGETVSGIMAALRQRFPRLSLADISIAVNQEFAPLDYVLKDGDEIALLPPVSGG